MWRAHFAFTNKRASRSSPHELPKFLHLLAKQPALSALKALRETIALPSAVRGPVDFFLPFMSTFGVEAALNWKKSYVRCVTGLALWNDFGYPDSP